MLAVLAMLSRVLAQDATTEQSATKEVERTIILPGDVLGVDELQIESVTTLDLKEIQRRGERTTEQLLRNLTFANANGVRF